MLWVSAANGSRYFIVEASGDCNKYILLNCEETRRIAIGYLKNGSAINCVLNIVPICLQQTPDIFLFVQCVHISNT